MSNVRVLVVGLGNMGLSHARAYAAIDGFEIAGLCSRDIEARPEIAAEFPSAPRFSDYAAALKATRPDAVSINTWPDTHAPSPALRSGGRARVHREAARGDGGGGAGDRCARAGRAA